MIPSADRSTSSYTIVLCYIIYFEQQKHAKYKNYMYFYELQFTLIYILSSGLKKTTEMWMLDHYFHIFY